MNPACGVRGLASGSTAPVAAPAGRSCAATKVERLATNIVIAATIITLRQFWFCMTFLLPLGGNLQGQVDLPNRYLRPKGPHVCPDIRRDIPDTSPQDFGNLTKV